MQVVAGWNNNSANKLNLNKIGFKLFNCDKNITFCLMMQQQKAISESADH